MLDHLHPYHVGKETLTQRKGKLVNIKINKTTPIDI